MRGQITRMGKLAGRALESRFRFCNDAPPFLWIFSHSHRRCFHKEGSEKVSVHLHAGSANTSSKKLLSIMNLTPQVGKLPTLADEHDTASGFCRAS